MIGETANTAAAGSYYDFNEIAALRNQAQKDPQQAARAVAEQFESVFLSMMLKAMRDATPEGGLFDSEQMKAYQSMHDQQAAISLAKSGGIGLADVIERQLSGEPAKVTRSVNDNPFMGLRQHQIQQQSVYSPATDTARIDVTEQPDDHWQPASSAQFIRDLWTHAKPVADKLGIDPEALIAQAALETGWGQKVMQHRDGRSSFNLFGIKADSRWDGDTVRVQTLEYRNGVAVREQASFRAYDSLKDSFDDFAAFLTENPRYTEALRTSVDSRGFYRTLQEAGYATDPKYAEKISAIMATGSYQQTVNQLKNSGFVPTSS